MKTRLTTRLIAVLCLMLLCMSMATPALAANNVCSTVGGNYKKATTFIVHTGGGLFKGKIILTQPKTAASVKKLFCGYKETARYAAYFIEVRKISGGTKNADVREGENGLNWNCTKTRTISGLQRNAVYRITVTPADSANNTLLNLFGITWLATPTWTAKRTAGVTYCA